MQNTNEIYNLHGYKYRIHNAAFTAGDKRSSKGTKLRWQMTMVFIFIDLRYVTLQFGVTLSSIWLWDKSTIFTTAILTALYSTPCDDQWAPLDNLHLRHNRTYNCLHNQLRNNLIICNLKLLIQYECHWNVISITSSMKRCFLSVAIVSTDCIATLLV